MFAARAGLAFVVVSFPLASHSLADVIRVPADRATIQAAIDAAAPGDVVLVAPGRYAELINFAGKAITVRSENGPAVTIIDAAGRSDPAVTFAARETAASRLEGFTITGVRATAQDLASGIRILGTSPTIADCIIADNRGFPAGGMNVDRGRPTIRNVQFLRNAGTDAGGLAVSRGRVDIAGSTFDENLGHGGGIYAVASQIVLADSTFARNGSEDVLGNGGGVFLNGCTFDLRRVTFDSNGTSERLPDGSTLYRTFAGGGLFALTSSGTIDASRFVGNAANRGGGVYFRNTREQDRILVTNSLFNANSAGGTSGAAYSAQLDVTFANNTFVNNDGILFTDFTGRALITNSVLATTDSRIAGTQIVGNGLASVAFSILPTQASPTVTLLEGNITARTPRFLDADGPDNVRGTLDDDFRLASDSPGVDAGRNDLLPAGLSLDLASQPRFVDDPVVDDTGAGMGAIIDMGAFEFQTTSLCPADFNRDGFVDWFDALLYISRFEDGSAAADFNADGFLDWFDYDAFIAVFETGC
jgi:hypothetical protein